MKLADIGSLYALQSCTGQPLHRLHGLIALKNTVYKPRKMKKKGRVGEFRTVYIVSDEDLKKTHKKIALLIERSWEPTACVHGWLKGRSIRTHATPHCGKDWVVTADIFDFFQSIPEHSVREVFITLGANPEVAAFLTDLTTLNGRLPAGTRCSPIIANLVCSKLDESLARLCENYTRYGDDVAFSGVLEDVPTAAMIAAAMRNSGFTLRDGSYFCIGSNRVQRVCGLIVNSSNGPHVDPARKRALSQQVHYISTYSLQSHCKRIGESDPESYEQRLMGQLVQIGSVEPHFARRQLTLLGVPIRNKFRGFPKKDVPE